MDTNLLNLRVDQVGGLAATRDDFNAYQAFIAGKLDAAAWRQRQDDMVRGVLREQERIGFPILSDGELRRTNFQDSFAGAVSGFDVPEGSQYDLQRGVHAGQANVRAEQDFAGPGPAIFTRRPVKSRLNLVRNVPLEEYRFAAANAKTPVKVTLLGPDRIVQRFDWENSRRVYPGGMEEFLADVVAIERKMIEQLVAAGCRYIQIDAPGYTAYVDQISRDRMTARGEDPDANLARSIAADNAVIAGFDVVFGLHVCRGNPRTRDPKTGKIVGQWHREGKYDAIAEQLFTGLKHQRLLLEYDTERAGDFTPLRFVPKDKTAVLGIVTTKDSDTESKDALKRRIDEAARHLSLDQLALSPQCGFGALSPNVMDQADQWRKLARIVETAAEVWH